MSYNVISVEHLTKQYDLGVIGTGTISRDLNRWWARVRKQPDPYTRIGQKDAFARIGESILALDDVSFTVQQGEALGIIGRNGAGKSTLLKILSRVTAPSSGVVKVRGRIGSLLEVGTGFHPELTGRENVYLNGAILGMKKAEVARKFDEIVSFAGVEKFIDTPVKRYSSGMYVRLAFAVAAHLDPEILIVDEVLAVGDAEFQKKCLGKMGDVATEGRTVLFVSHNMAAIQTLCKRAILLIQGKITDDAPAELTVSRYLNAFSSNVSDNLAVRTDRNGSGRSRIVKIIALNPFNNLNPLLIPGSPVRFDFYYSQPLIEPSMAFTLYDETDVAIATFDSTVRTPNNDQSSSEANVFSCQFGEFLLSPGSYFVNVALRDHEELVDHVEKAFHFTVNEGIFHGQRIKKNRLSRFVMEHQWVKPEKESVSGGVS